MPSRRLACLQGGALYGVVWEESVTNLIAQLEQ